MDAIIIASQTSIDGLITAWLHAKAGRSGSIKTRRAYADAINSFRAALHGVGLDLDGAPEALALALQGWAGRGDPSPATYNHRLAVISSFYRYAIRLGVLRDNPADRVDRRRIEAYRAAAQDVMPPRAFGARLRAIDRSTLAGKRDYALLWTMVMTGWRIGAIQALRRSSLRILDGARVTLSARTKGGRAATATLGARDAAPLLDWLYAAYGADLGALDGDAPIWVAVRGKRTPLTVRQIQRIVGARLGIRAHAVRAQFATLLDAAGAKPREIQTALGHASVATTERYLAALRREVNPYADAMADLLFGDV